jgi:biopolymer transport protein ExbB
MIAALAALVVLGLLAAPNAHAWWDGKWKQRMKIQFDTSAKAADIKESLIDVPVLIRLHTGNFSFSNAKADGSDIRFVSADDKTPLKYHIEKFDPKEEIALIWVKVPGYLADPSRILSGYTTAMTPCRTVRTLEARSI